MMYAILFTITLLWATPSQAHHTTLHTAATNLAVGSWVEVTTTNIVSTLAGTGGVSGFIFGYTDKMVWDHVGHAGYYIGSDHPSEPGNVVRFVKYDEATNTWSILTTPSWVPDVTVTPMHGYHHTAIDWIGRKLYHRPSSNQVIQRYDLTAGTWSAIPTMSGAIGYNTVAAGVDFLPWLGSQGWLLYHSVENGSNGTVIRYDPTSNDWATPTGGNETLPVGTEHFITECSIVARDCIMGGGNGNANVHRIVERETISATVTTAPASYGVNASIVTHDPVSGKYLFFWTESSWQEYNSVTNTWTDLSGTTASVLSAPNASAVKVHGVVAMPLYDYGVIMFAKCSSSTVCTVWLYKHTASDAATKDFYANRCLVAGVKLCVGFDSSVDLTGSTRGGMLHVDTLGTEAPVRDTSVKASGLASIKMTIPANADANDANSWHHNFRDDMTGRVGASSEFYYSWRQRFSPCFLFTGANDAACAASTTPRAFSGGGGWKLSIVGTGGISGSLDSDSGATSCSDMEVVTQNTSHRGFAQMYNSCSGSASHSAFDAFEEAYNGSDFKLQNARPSPFCLYSQLPGLSNCFPFYANEWLTFKVHVTTGARSNGEFTSSSVDLFVARDGDTAWTQLFDWGPYNLTAPGTQEFGKIWLLPYNTSKSAAETNPESYVWYDDVIVSSSDIAVPGGASTTISITGGVTFSGSVSIQ